MFQLPSRFDPLVGTIYPSPSELLRAYLVLFPACHVSPPRVALDVPVPAERRCPKINHDSSESSDHFPIFIRIQSFSSFLRLQFWAKVGQSWDALLIDPI